MLYIYEHIFVIIIYATKEGILWNLDSIYIFKEFALGIWYVKWWCRKYNERIKNKITFKSVLYKKALE